MDRESSTQAESTRFHWHAAFSIPWHAACREAAPPPALFEDERLRVLGDAFQQFDVSPVAGFIERLGE
jgi:hypothetical protein